MGTIRFASSLLLVTTLLSSLSSARYHSARANLEDCDNVAACRNLLVNLRAGAFGSAFVPIRVATVTVTKTGTSTTAQVTVTEPCVNAQSKRGLDGDEQKKEQVSIAPSQPAGAATLAARATTKSSTTSIAPNCPVKGVPAPVAVFACDVIKDACRALVKPKTMTVR